MQRRNNNNNSKNNNNNNNNERNKKSPSASRWRRCILITSFATILFLITLYGRSKTLVQMKNSNSLKPPSTSSSSSSSSQQQQQLITNDKNPSAAAASVVFPSSLDTLISKKGTIIGDVSSMLDFAIIGFPKCGTTTMMSYLNQNSSSPRLWVPPDERWELEYDNVDSFVRYLHDHSPSSSSSSSSNNIKRGIKCPDSLERYKTLQHYEKYFYNTDFIIGVRHPVDWFVSFYRYRVTESSKKKNKRESHFDPNYCIGNCKRCNICTDRSRFHHFLYQLGKTNLTYEEWELMGYTDDEGGGGKGGGGISVVPHGEPTDDDGWKPPPVVSMPSSRVFLYDVRQLESSQSNDYYDSDNNNTTTTTITKTAEQRQLAFRRDLSAFLGFNHQDDDDEFLLPPMIHVRPGRRNNNNNQTTTTSQSPLKWNFICRGEYDRLRGVLMENAINASRWIRNYFLNGNNVVVSDREYFEMILKGWERDPCDLFYEMTEPNEFGDYRRRRRRRQRR